MAARWPGAGKKFFASVGVPVEAGVATPDGTCSESDIEEALDDDY